MRSEGRSTLCSTGRSYSTVMPLPYPDASSTHRHAVYPASRQYGCTLMRLSVNTSIRLYVLTVSRKYGRL